MNGQCDFSRHSPRTSRATLIYLTLLSCLAQSGCDQKPSIEIQVEQPTHDAAGFLIQPEQDFLIGGKNSSWKHLFIQFDVIGSEDRPFILNIDNSIRSHDDWPLAPDPKNNKPSGSALLLSPAESPSRPFGSVSLNSDEVDMIVRAAQKYVTWSDTAAKENLNVEGKEIMSLTNRHLGIGFSRSKEFSNSFMHLHVPDNFAFQNSLPSLPFYITLDKRGVERLQTVITNLPDRRKKFIAFRDEQMKIARQRNEAQLNEKARADELLH